MRGENAGVLDAMSDLSESSDSDEELLHVMDPSDPRAHRSAPVVQPTRTKTRQNQTASRWDSDDVGEPISVDSDSENQKNQTAVVIEDDDAKETVAPVKKVVTLSKWAARFLVPASERKIPVFEEPPLEPLNDFILSDFSSRYRGNAGDVEVEKEIKADDDEVQKESNKMQVGAPLFDANSTNNDKEKEDGDDEEENRGKKSKKKKKEDGRKRKENRYFVTDLATKCFHCGEVGHMANVCMNDKLQLPCYYCALRGHQAWACPNLPCGNCLQLGHQERDCNNRTLNIEPCGNCGRSGHIEDDCDNIGNQEQVTCMVCTKVGHLQCVPVPPPADRHVYCPHCSKNHALEECHTYDEPAATDFATRTASGRTVQTCFVCNEAGHIAAECPVRSNGYNRSGGNCFKCGKPGHFAADCNSSNNSSSNGRRVTGRKRGRDVEDEYPDYNGYDYDEDEDYYSYDRSSKGGKKNRNRGGSSRSRNNSGNKGYARLNEALPTRPYRNNNSYGERRRNSRR